MEKKTERWKVTIIHEVQDDLTIKHREEKNGIPKKRKKTAKKGLGMVF